MRTDSPDTIVQTGREVDKKEKEGIAEHLDES